MPPKDNVVRRDATHAPLLLVLHLLWAGVGMLTRGEGQPAPIIAPAPAVLFAFLLMRPPREWGSYCFAAFTAELIFDAFAYSIPLKVGILFGLANVAEGLTGASLLVLILRERIDLARTRHSTMFVVVGGAIAPAVGAIIGGSTLHFNYHADLWMETQRWWFGDAITHFTVTPSIVVGWKITKLLSEITRHQLLRMAAFVVVVTSALAILPIFSESYYSIPLPEELALLPLPFILWLASRERLVVLSIGNTIATIISLILLSLFHLSEASDYRVIETQLFLSIVAATILTTGALFEEKLVALNAVEARRATEQRSAQANKLQALGLLTGGIAHDINNLLGLIGLRLELTKKGLPDNAPQIAQLKSASEAVDRGARLVRRLLVFSRTQPLSQEVYNLNELVDSLTALLRKTIGVEITLAFFPADKTLRCSVDGAELEAAIVNLIVNARDALGGSGVIQIRLSRDEVEGAEDVDATGKIIPPGDYARIVVSDNGCGMSPETLKHCFDPFFTTKDLNNGTGLGLSTVVGFVHQSGGGIYVKSIQKKGTEFSLLLPLAEDDEVLAPKLEEAPSNPGQRTILIVEDNSELRDALAALLRQKDLNVEEAASAPEALDKLSSNRDISLILSDIMMPGGMSGVELAQRVQDQSPQIKILLMTGYAGNALSRVQAVDCAFEVVRKPFDFEDLASRIAKMLD